MRILALLALAIAAAGCASFDMEAVSARRSAIEDTYSVKLDISKTSPFLGDTMTTLDRIERSVSIYPDGYRRKIAKINVVESFADRYGLLASGVAAYTEDEIPEKYRQIFVQNKSVLEDILGALSLDFGLHIEHEAWHSVEYYEVQLLESMISVRARVKPKSLWDVLEETDTALVNFTPAEVETAVANASSAAGRRQLRAYVWLIKGWLASHFGDVDKNGVIDDADMLEIDRRRAEYDADKDGRLAYGDVEKLTHYGYMRAENPLNPGLQIGLTFGALGFHARGFISFYAQNFPYEDRAEVVDHISADEIIPWLYRAGDAGRTDNAWRKFKAIRKGDPVIGRKVELISRYIALHEDPSKLNERWTKTYRPLGEFTTVLSPR